MHGIGSAVQFTCGFCLLCFPVVAFSQPVAPTESEADSLLRNEVDELILLLGADAFRVRESASERLIQLGTVVVPSLRSGTRHQDREVRFRCTQIMRAITMRDRQDRINALLAGDDSRLGELPAWDYFRDKVGDSAVSRQLYVEMLKDEWDMLEGFASRAETETSIPSVITERCAEINDAQRVFRQGISLGTIMTVLFLASDDGVEVADVTGQQIYSLLYQTSFRAAINQADRRETIRSILGRWIERDSGQWTTHYALNLSLEHDLKEGLKPAKRIVNQRGGEGKAAVASHIRQYAVLVIAKLGSAEHYQLLQELFDDETVCSRQQIRSTVTFQTQMRDIALAARIHLAGQNPAEFGFDRLQPNSRNVFNPTSLGFVDDQARMKAFDKWSQWVEQNEPKAAG